MSRSSRCLLHRNQLDAFLSWLNEKEIEHRPGKGVWEVRQVKVRDKFEPIHDSSRTEHLTVQAGVKRLVHEWIKSRRKGALHEKDVA